MDAFLLVSGQFSLKLLGCTDLRFVAFDVHLRRLQIRVQEPNFVVKLFLLSAPVFTLTCCHDMDL